MALNAKQFEVLDKWILEKKNETYYRLDPQFEDCNSLKGIWVD